jgi:polysaccharide export outer membrane protein
MSHSHTFLGNLTMSRCVLLLFTAAILAPASNAVGQQVDQPTSTPQARGALWDREDMVSQLEELERMAASPDSSDELRARYRREIEAIEERLELGDFRLGDRVAIFVEGEAALTDTFTVNRDRELDLVQLGVIPLTGVLRSELEGRVQAHVAQFVRDPVVRATPLLNVMVLGQVSQPGFYTVSWDALIGDVYMAAGGLESESKIEALKIRRAGVEVYQGQVIQDAIVAGTSLDQLNLQDGDEFEVPERGRFWTTVRNIGALAGTLILITVFVTR